MICITSPDAKYCEKSRDDILHLQSALFLWNLFQHLLLPAHRWGLWKYQLLFWFPLLAPTSQILGGQSVINSADECGQFLNICNVLTFIICNWNHKKWLYLALKLTLQVCRKIRNLVCNCLVRLFKTHNLCSLQHACLNKFTHTR